MAITGVTNYPVTIKVENEFGESDTKDINIQVMTPSLGWKAKYDYLEQIHTIDYPYLTSDLSGTISFIPSAYINSYSGYTMTFTVSFLDPQSTVLSTYVRTQSAINTTKFYNFTSIAVPLNILFRSRHVRFSFSSTRSFNTFNQPRLTNILTNEIINVTGPTSGNVTPVTVSLKTTVNTNLISSLNYYQIFSNEGKIYYMNFDDTNMFTSQSYTKSLTSVAHTQSSIYEVSTTALNKLSVAPQLLNEYQEVFSEAITDATLRLSEDETILSLGTPLWTKVYNTLDMSEAALLAVGSEFSDISYNGQWVGTSSGVYSISDGSSLLLLSGVKYHAFFRDNSRVVFCTNNLDPLSNKILIYNCSSWVLEREIQFPREVNSCKIDKNNNFLILGSTSDTKPLTIYNLTDYSEMLYYPERVEDIIRPSRDIQLLPR